MDPDLSRLKELRPSVRSCPNLDPLSVVVFSLRSEGLSIMEISRLKISDISKLSISDDVKKDIWNYIHRTMEYRLLETILRGGPMRLSDIGRQMAMRRTSDITNIHSNYLKHMVRKGIVMKDGMLYRTTRGRVNSYIQSLYITRFRPDKKSSRESLYGYFREAVRSVNSTPVCPV